jgi:uncharacterized protein YjdB
VAARSSIVTTSIRAATSALLVLGCAGDSIVGTTGVTSVSAPTNVELEVGETRQITAVVIAEHGTSTGVTWRSSNPSVATVVAAGSGEVAEVTALSLGASTLRVTSMADTTKFAETQVTVGAAPVAVVSVAPTTPDVIKGQSLTLVATARSARGVVVSGHPVTWMSSNPGAATVSDQGVVAGVAFGSATITASIDGVSGTALVTVKSGPAAQLALTPPNPQITRGGTMRLTLLVRDAFGNDVDLAGKIVEWTSSSPTVASVGNDGAVVALATGQSLITAAVDGKSASTTVSVADAPPATIRIAQGPRSIEERKTLHLDAVTRDAAGNVLSVSPSWRSVDVQIATVSADGSVTGVAASATPARVIASVPASGTSTLADTAFITVTLAAAATVQVSIAATSIEVGEQTAASATVRGDAGQVLTGRVVTWSSSAPTVATVSAAGVVTGVGPGSATISAQREGKTGSATVQVVPAAPDRLDLSPVSANISLGATQTFTASVRDKRGGLVADCPITWTTSNPAIATVSAGVVTGVAVGSASVTARCLTKQATASVTITAGAAVTFTAVYLAGTTTPASLSSLSGDVDAVVSYTNAGETPLALDLVVDGSVVSTINSPLDACPNACRLALSTAEFSLATGAIRFHNGSRTLEARLKLVGGATVTASLPIVLNNPDAFVATLTPNGTGAISPNFEWWYGGPAGGATAVVKPLLFSAKSIASVSVRIGSGPVLTRAASPFAISFSAATYAGYTSHTSPDPLVITGSTYADGSAGPTRFIDAFEIPKIRLDFVAPTPPKTEVMPIFVNRTYDFFNTNLVGGTDSGVGGVRTLVGVTTGALPPMGSTCFDGLTLTSLGSQLAETATQSVYRGRATSIDALGNPSCADLQPGGLAGGTFGADFTPPTMSVSLGPTDGSISSTPTQSFLVAPSDNAAGFGITPIRVSITKSFQGTTTCVIGNGPTCAPFDEPYGFPSNDGSNGFYTATIRVSDQAGNLSTTVTRSYLSDNVAPVVGQLGIPADLNYRDGGGRTVFSFAAADNIGLATASATLSYGSTVLGRDIGSLGGLFGPPFLPSIIFSFNWPGMVRCIDNVKPSAMGITVRDQAGLTGSATLTFPTANVEDCAPFDIPAGSTLKFIGANPSSVSRSSGFTLLSLAMEVPLSSSSTAPFAFVYVFQPDGNTYRFAGASTGSLVQNESTRTWTYTTAWNPPDTTPIGNVPLLVLMVDQNGDAASSVLTVPVTP